MDVVPILSTIILIATIITFIVAVASYMTFRVKEKKKQAALAEARLTAASNSDGSEFDEGTIEIEQISAPAPLPVAVQASAPVAQPSVIVNVQAPQAYPMPEMSQQVVAAQQLAEQSPQPQYAPEPPPGPAYSGAQAAFMKGFGGQTPPPPPHSQGAPAPTMRRFTMPEARPTQKQAPENSHHETPSWK